MNVTRTISTHPHLRPDDARVIRGRIGQEAAVISTHPHLRPPRCSGDRHAFLVGKGRCACGQMFRVVHPSATVDAVWAAEASRRP